MAISRRTYLESMSVGLLSLGCIEREKDPYTKATADLDLDVRPPEATTPVMFAHWFPPGSFQAVVERAASDVDLKFERFDDRRSLEGAVADAFVAADPPDLLHTVLGEELRRYVLVSELDAIGDEIDERFPPTVHDLAMVDDALYAVPIGIMPVNGLFRLRSSDDELVPADIQGSDSRLVEVFDEHRFGVRETGANVFQLVCQCLLSLEGVAPYRTLSAGELDRATFTRAMAAAMSIMESIHWLPRRPARADLTTCSALLVDPRLASLVSADRWVAEAFPGTRSIAVLHASGICLPTRADAPLAARDVIRTATGPSVREEIADQAGQLSPRGIGRHEGLARIVTEADVVLPAASTGCGLHTDLRWRAVQRLRPSDIAGSDPQEIVDELAPLLR